MRFRRDRPLREGRSCHFPTPAAAARPWVRHLDASDKHFGESIARRRRSARLTTADVSPYEAQLSCGWIRRDPVSIREAFSFGDARNHRN